MLSTAQDFSRAALEPDIPRVETPQRLPRCDRLPRGLVGNHATRRYRARQHRGARVAHEGTDVLHCRRLPRGAAAGLAYELTPDGVKRERDVDRSASITHTPAASSTALSSVYWALPSFFCSSIVSQPMTPCPRRLSPTNRSLSCHSSP